MNSRRARVDSGVAGGKVSVFDYCVGEQDAACPAHPGVPVVLGEVESASLSREESKVDERLFCGRRMGTKDQIEFTSTTVEQLPRGDRVGCLGSREERHFRDERPAVVMPDSEGAGQLLRRYDASGEQQCARAQYVPNSRI